MTEQNHRSQPAIAGEFLSEFQSVNTAITGGWVQTLGKPLRNLSPRKVLYKNKPFGMVTQRGNSLH
jgi:hypothetical protein